jgi:hypothetical protein
MGGRFMNRSLDLGMITIEREIKVYLTFSDIEYSGFLNGYFMLSRHEVPIYRLVFLFS